MTIHHGTKEEWAGEWLEQTGFFNGASDQSRTYFDTAKWLHGRESEGILKEFIFRGETWRANPLAC